MTDFRTSDRDVNRAIRSWLHEDRHEDVSRVAGTVLDRVEATPQRRATWWPARRTPTVNKFLAIGLGAAAVVVALLVGAQLLSSPNGGLGAEPTRTATPSSQGMTPGTLSLWHANLGMRISVAIPAPGWYGRPDIGFITKNQNAAAPDGAGLIVFANTNDLLVGMGDIYVYGDPCHWESTKPDTPVATVDEAVAALSDQPTRNASAPVDVTVDGYAGKSITLHVPDDAVFSDCARGEFRTLIEGEDSPRYHQDPGQIDKLWIVDVDGELVIFDAGYYDGTPQSVLDELDAIVMSATLEYAP